MPLSRLAPASFASALSAAAAALLLAQSADAQQTPQKCPSRMAFRWRQRGLRISRATGPFNYKTAEQQDVRVTVFTSGPRVSLQHGRSCRRVIARHRAGRRLRIHPQRQARSEAGVRRTASKFAGKSGAIGAVHGYMTVVAHPQFAQNHWIYFSYTKLLAEQQLDGRGRARRAEGWRDERPQGRLGRREHSRRDQHPRNYR